MQAFADLVRMGKVLYIGVSEWTADQLREGARLAKELGFQLISNQPQYNAIWRVIEPEVIPTSKELGISQIVWSPIAQGVLTGKYKPGQPHPEGSRATDDKGGANMISRWMRDDVLTGVQDLEPIAKELDLSLAQLAIAWVLQNDNVASAIIGASRPEQVHENVKASGVNIPLELMERIDEVLGERHRARPEAHPGQQPEAARGVTLRASRRPPTRGLPLLALEAALPGPEAATHATCGSGRPLHSGSCRTSSTSPQRRGCRTRPSPAS